jgi:hypothetical protein
MKWTIQWFKRRVQLWDERARLADDNHLAGAAAYACRQSESWKAMGKSAEQTFIHVQGW